MLKEAELLRDGSLVDSVVAWAAAATPNPCPLDLVVPVDSEVLAAAAAVSGEVLRVSTAAAVVVDSVVVTVAVVAASEEVIPVLEEIETA